MINTYSRKIIIASISILIAVFLCVEVSHALRPPIGNIEKRTRDVSEIVLEDKRQIGAEEYVDEIRGVLHDLGNKIGTFRMALAYLARLSGKTGFEIMRAYPEEDQDRYMAGLSFYHKTRSISLFLPEAKKKIGFLNALVEEMKSLIAELETRMDLIPEDKKEEAQRSLKTIKGVTEDAEALLSRLEVRVSRGRNLEKINLDEWHHRYLQAMFIYYARGIRTYVDIDPEITLLADVDEFNRIFFNLIINSVRSITARWEGQGGMIEIFARRKDGNAVITMRDNGVGIDIWSFDLIAEERGRTDLVEEINRMLDDKTSEPAQLIFEPWFSTKPGKKGGEGLNIVRDIVRRYEGGDIRVRSAGLGEGATFTITLPLGSMETVGAEEAFREIYGSDLFADEVLSTGRMVDELGISVDDDVLCVGPGKFWPYIIACALRGAKVDIVQPERDEYFLNQELGSEIELNARRIKLRYGIDVLPRIDNSSYQTLLEHADVPEQHYSYAFVLHVLDIIDDERKKEEFIAKLLSSLKNESYILISAWGRGTEKEVRTLQAYGKKLGYDIEGPVDSFRAVDTTVFRLKVSRNKKADILHRSIANQSL